MWWLLSTYLQAKIWDFLILFDKRARTKCNYFESFDQQIRFKLVNTIQILPWTMATSTPSTPNIQRREAAYTLVYTLWDYMCSGFAGLTQYSQRGVVVFKRCCKTSSMVHLLFRIRPLESNYMHRIEVYNQRRKPTLTVDMHGVVDDNGGGTTTSKRHPQHRCLLFFIR